MKKHLFYTFLSIFIATAVVTILGVLKMVDIEKGYLNVLFTSLIIELIGSVIGLYKATDFFSQDNDDAGRIVDRPEDQPSAALQQPAIVTPSMFAEVPPETASESGEKEPTRTYDGTFQDFIAGLNAAGENFLQQQEFLDNLNGAYVRWRGKVYNVSNTKIGNSGNTFVLLFDEQGAMSINTFFAVDCPGALRTKAFSLRRGDVVTVHGVLDTTMPTLPTVKADRIEFKASPKAEVEQKNVANSEFRRR